MINSEQMAELLDNFDCKDQFTPHVIKLAKKHGLVIVSAFGDDIITLSGAITDEFDLFKGGDVFISRDSGGEYVSYTKQCEEFKRKKINVFWEEHKLFTWKFITLIPNHKFTIKRNNKNFCQGIVFGLCDI